MSNLTEKRAANAASHTINPLPPGAVVRVDTDSDNGGKVNLTPEKALAMANALAALADKAKEGTARSDAAEAVEELKEKKGEKKEDDDSAPSWAKALMGKLDSFEERLKKFETRKDGGVGVGEVNDDDGEGEKPHPKADSEDRRERKERFDTQMSVERADASVCTFKTEHIFAAFQARADAVAQLYSHSAPRPLSGETLAQYKIRTVRSWQSLSPTFKNSDLRVLSKADSVAFNHVIDEIMKAAEAEGMHPKNVPLGQLVQRVDARGGHTTTRFYGNPRSWMAGFAPPSKRVKRIIERDPGGNHKTLFEAAR